MKQINFGIAIMVFGYVFEQSFNLEAFAAITGVMGLLVAVAGLNVKEK